MEFHSPSLLHPSLPVSNDPPRLSRGFHIRLKKTACARFTPNKSGQRLPPLRITAAAAHEVSRGFLVRIPSRGEQLRLTLVLLSTTEFYDPKTFFTTRRCSVRLSSIAEDSLLLPPVGVWAVSQSQCGRSPSQVGYASVPW